MLQIGGIAWVGLYAENPALLATFYRDKVGLQLRESTEGCHIFALGSAGVLEIWGNGTARLQTKTPAEQSSVVGFLVDDLELALSELAKRGLFPISPVGSYGVERWVYFADPEGNRFELKEANGATRPK